MYNRFVSLGELFHLFSFSLFFFRTIDWLSHSWIELSFGGSTMAPFQALPTIEANVVFILPG